ncbi:MAG: hypothetical protein HGB14_06590, partial [Anaerolineaceae bacterium]|nr:hypothetical protein [Anaerolineaceae bacterium]
DRQRPILSFDLGVTMDGEFGVSNDPEYSIPPFFQFGKVSVIDCDRFYSLSLRNGFAFEKQLVEGYETPCDYVNSSDTQVLQFILEHLKENKFDISSLEAWIGKYSNQ